MAMRTSGSETGGSELGGWVLGVMLRWRLSLAWRLDRLEERLLRLGEKWGWPQAWLHELCEYLGDPRMTQEEFWVRYTMKRIEVQPTLLAITDEAGAMAYYARSDYTLWRQVVHRRHSAWRRILRTMRGQMGSMLEFGCGIAPITAWMQPRKQAWKYAIDDIPGSAHFRYAAWRVKNQTPSRHYNVITAFDVFEHLADPEKAARTLVDRLAPRGYLHWNFVPSTRSDLDLATDLQRQQTCVYLNRALELVWESGGNYCSRRRIDYARDTWHDS